MRESSFLSLGPHGFHRVVYSEWGDTGNDRVVVCVHGLTRNGRDFDWLARALCAERRVACPDVAGRGRSDWLGHGEDYGYALYCQDLAALVARLGVDEVDWVGTSMGGLLGMLLAAQPGTPIRRLVMNDVGPFVPKAALERIAEYVGKDPRFPDVEALDAYLQTVYAPFGPMTAEQWRGLVEGTARRTSEGDIGLAYDPAIATPLTSGPLEDVDLWEVWEAVRAPVLLLRGETSDVLPAETAAEMRCRRPDVEFAEFPGIGHAPMLMSEDQIGLVREWLLR